MADNETPIALPEQTEELDGILAGAVQPTAQAADQHIEPTATSVAPADATGAPAPAPTAVGDPGTASPTGTVINTQ
jgi:hypothetical protein